MVVSIQSPILLSSLCNVSAGAVSIAVKPSDLTAFLPKSIMTSLTDIPASLYLNKTELGTRTSLSNPSNTAISSADV